MDSLKYKRTEILARLQENRAKHETAFKEAEEGFHEAVIVELAESLKLAKAGKEYRLSLKQTKPVHHLKEYDRAIQMFTMCSQAEVELEESEFTKYVLDNWNWSDVFASTARTYSKSGY